MSVAEADRSVGSMVAGKYRLVRTLGQGGMGAVWEAEHAITHRRVAVKMLLAQHRDQPQQVRRFLNEAQTAGILQHPNLIEVLDAGEDSDGSMYVVLELLEGTDLCERLVEERRLEIVDTLTIVAQILQALVVAHGAGVVHRDIKPDNIFLARSHTGDVLPKLLDFGIARMASTGGPALSITQANTTVGTPHYMSPEQARGVRDLDGRSDLWSLAVVTYECLAGRLPFDGEGYNDQIARVIASPHESLTGFDVPLDLARIVDRALEKDRQRRYADAATMLADLRSFVAKHPQYGAVPSQFLREPEVRARVSELASISDDAPTVVRTPESIGLPGTQPRPRAARGKAARPPWWQLSNRQAWLVVAMLLVSALSGSLVAWLLRPRPQTSAPVPASPPSSASRATPEPPPDPRVEVPRAEPTIPNTVPIAPSDRALTGLTVRGLGCTLVIDGVIRGPAPRIRLSVAPGPHRVLCRTDTGALRARDVMVEPGHEAVVDFGP